MQICSHWYNVYTGYGNAGLVIPIVDGLSFVNPQLTLGQVTMIIFVLFQGFGFFMMQSFFPQGYILINTDINYKPNRRAAAS